MRNSQQNESVPQTMIARSRSHLVSLLENRIRRSHADAPAGSRRPGNAVPVKTYLVEGRGPTPREPAQAGDDDSPLGALAEMTGDTALRQAFGTRVHSSEDPDLATIEFTQDGGPGGHVYVDFADPRYWLLHTFAVSRLADRFVSALASVRSGVGRATLPGEFLGTAASLGSTIALTLEHERRVFAPGGGSGASDFLRARIWGTRAARLLSLARRPGNFAEGMALSTVQVKYQLDGGDDGRFCVDDMRWDGRIMTRGTSFLAHRQLTEAIQACYRRQVARIESLHSLRIEQGDRVLRGRSLAVHLTRPIQNLERFCRMVFSSASPFLLWGRPVMRGPHCAGVAGVDLNFGQQLAFEFTPEFIRLFLPGNTSGGTVLRFYTNLQRRLDPRVRLLDQEEREVLEL